MSGSRVKGLTENRVISILNIHLKCLELQMFKTAEKFHRHCASKREEHIELNPKLAALTKAETK